MSREGGSYIWSATKEELDNDWYQNRFTVILEDQLKDFEAGGQRLWKILHMSERIQFDMFKVSHYIIYSQWCS